MSDILTRGLDRHSERACLAVCLGVAVSYLLGFAWLLHASLRFDQAFLAQRQAALFQQMADHPLLVGQPVTVSAATPPPPGLDLLGGWSVQEAGGVWSQAARAELAIQLPRQHPDGLSLELRGVAMPDASGHQAFRLEVDGQAIGTWDLAQRRARLCAALPNQAPGATGPLRVTLLIEHPTQPPGGQDHRVLGLFLQQVAIWPQPCDPVDAG